LKTLFLLITASSLLFAGNYASFMMGGTLFVLFLILIFSLFIYTKRLHQERLKYSILYNYSDVPSLFLTPKGQIFDVNESALTLVGYTKKQLIKRKWYEKLLPDENALQVRHQIHQALKEDARYTFKSTLIRFNGTALEVNYTITLLPEPLSGYILTLVDITKNEAIKEELISVQEHLSETQMALEHLSEQFKVTFDIAINGIALLDENGNTTYINRALIEMFEYNEDYTKHLGLGLLVKDEESAQLLLESSKNGETIDKMHLHCNTRNGEKRDIDLTMGYLPDLKQYYMVVQDITKAMAYTAELKRSKQTLEQRVIKDCLTTAYNRSYMEERLEHLMLVEKEPFGFIILDIDHFKEVNDTYGHIVGDDVLINLVELLKKQLRKGDTLSRFGGEEFVVILPYASHEQTLKIASKLQKIIEESTFEGSPSITCSFGVESFDGTQDKRTLLLSADKALYKAKENGRNRVVDARTLSESDYTI